MAALLESSLHGAENSIGEIHPCSLHLLPESSQQFYLRMEENARILRNSFARILELLEELEIAESESAHDTPPTSISEQISSENASDVGEIVSSMESDDCDSSNDSMVDEIHPPSGQTDSLSADSLSATTFLGEAVTTANDIDGDALPPMMMNSPDHDISNARPSPSNSIYLHKSSRQSSLPRQIPMKITVSVVNRLVFDDMPLRSRVPKTDLPHQFRVTVTKLEVFNTPYRLAPPKPPDRLTVSIPSLERPILMLLHRPPAKPPNQVCRAATDTSCFCTLNFRRSCLLSVTYEINFEYHAAISFILSSRVEKPEEHIPLIDRAHNFSLYALKSYVVFYNELSGVSIHEERKLNALLNSKSDMVFMPFLVQHGENGNVILLRPDIDEVGIIYIKEWFPLNVSKALFKGFGGLVAITTSGQAVQNIVDLACLLIIHNKCVGGNIWEQDGEPDIGVGHNTIPWVQIVATGTLVRTIGAYLVDTSHTNFLCVVMTRVHSLLILVPQLPSLFDQSCVIWVVLSSNSLDLSHSYPPNIVFIRQVAFLFLMAQGDSYWHVEIEALKIIGLFEVLLATSCMQIQVVVMDSPLDSIECSSILNWYTHGGCLLIVGFTNMSSTCLTLWRMLLPFKKKEESMGNIEEHAKTIDVIILGAFTVSLLEFSHDNKDDPLHFEATGVDTILSSHHQIILSYDLESMVLANCSLSTHCKMSCLHKWYIMKSKKIYNISRVIRLFMLASGEKSIMGVYEDVLVCIYFYVAPDQLKSLNQKSMNWGICDSCPKFESTNFIGTWMAHSAYNGCKNCCSNCVFWHMTVKLSATTTKGNEYSPRGCSSVQENAQTEVVDRSKYIMRYISATLDNLSITVFLLLYQFEVLSSIMPYSMHNWKWNSIIGTTVNAKQVESPLPMMDIYNTGVEYFIHTEGSLQFQQWDPGDYSLVLEKGSLDLGAIYQDVVITLVVWEDYDMATATLEDREELKLNYSHFNLEDKIVFKGDGIVMNDNVVVNKSKGSDVAEQHDTSALGNEATIAGQMRTIHRALKENVMMKGFVTK